MYEQVRKVVLDSGLWDTWRIKTHGFVLSPSVYEISLEKRNELEALGVALHESLAGLGRIAAIACNPELGHGTTWRMIAKALRTGIPATYHDIMLSKPGTTPSICKVDLLEAADGSYQIAEIDGHNKHGLGYSTLAARMRRVLRPEASTFPGVAAMLASEARRRGSDSVVLLFANQERFYAPEFRILQSELVSHGVELLVVEEREVIVRNGKLVMPNDGREPRLFLDFPFLYHNPLLNAALVELYRSGEIDFLISPKPFFGSKAILGLLRNDLGDDELEAVLGSHINSESLSLLRRHIPTTYLIHRRVRDDFWRSLSNGKRFVLKESISSGMKGTVFTDDPRFTSVLEEACGSYYRFILQGEVVTMPRIFQYFTEGGELHTCEWFTRVTVHFALRRVADIVVTARRDKRVHGQLDALQLGAVIT